MIMNDWILTAFYAIVAYYTTTVARLQARFRLTPLRESVRIIPYPLALFGEDAMYQDRIVVDPGILVGKPVIRGTRIPVELVLKRLAQDLTIETLLEAYPRLTPEDVKACLEYAQALVAGEEVYPVTLATA
jgi:uncharacterized protein (DUF433 family)